MNADFLKRVLEGVSIDLMDKFDRNFERKAFFNEVWKTNKLANSNGSLLNRTGTLRRSLNVSTSGNRITFTSNVPYAAIQNTGGTLIITAKMQRFFWAKFLQLGGNKGGVVAQQFKFLALKKVGSQLIIPKRQFIGDHPEVHESVEHVVNAEMKRLNEQILNSFKR